RKDQPRGVRSNCEQRRILDRRMLTNSGETRIARILRSCRSSFASHKSDSGVGKVEAECASGAVAVTAQSKNFNRPSLSGPCLLTIPRKDLKVPSRGVEDGLTGRSFHISGEGAGGALFL